MVVACLLFAADSSYSGWIDCLHASRRFDTSKVEVAQEKISCLTILGLFQGMRPTSPAAWAVMRDTLRSRKVHL